MLGRRIFASILVVLCVIAVVKHARDPRPPSAQPAASRSSQRAAAAIKPALSPKQLDDGRKLYALIEAGDEYCPDLTQRWLVRFEVKYDLRLPGESEKLAVAKQEWFDQFKKVGRQLACSGLADEFGPGNDLHLFDLN